MFFSRSAAVLLGIIAILFAPLVARADGGWGARIEASVAKLEASVQKVDGKTAAKGKLDARLTALDARIGDIEVKVGRTRGSETIPTVGDSQVLLGKWTAALARMNSRFEDSQRPAKPKTPGAGAPTPDPGTLIASGTGFFITTDGDLVTCAHVVESGKSFRVATEAGQYSATVVKVDKERDLAILRVRGTFIPIAVCPSADVRLGAMVGTVGYPNPDLQGKSPKVTKGEISSLAGLRDDKNEFQVSLPVQPGNSGGALFDARGNVVGVVSSRLNEDTARRSTGATTQNVNYAVKSESLLKLIASVPGLKDRLPPLCTEEQKFEDVVALAQKATGMVLVYDASVADVATGGSPPGGRSLPTTIEELDLFPENFSGKSYFVDRVWIDGDIDRRGDFILMRATSPNGKSTVNVPRKDGIVFALSKRLAQKLLAVGVSSDSKYLARIAFDVSLVDDDWFAMVREISIYSKAGTILTKLTE